jgi:hypothetical protein
MPLAFFTIVKDIHKFKEHLSMYLNLKIGITNVQRFFENKSGWKDVRLLVHIIHPT